MTKTGRPKNKYIVRKKVLRECKTITRYAVFERGKKVYTYFDTKPEALAFAKKMNGGQTK